MENQDWVRDIENIMSDYFNQYMNNSQQNNNASGFSRNNNQRYYTDSRAREEISEHRMYTLINEFMQDYYANMRLYQQNMRDVIQLIREFRSNMQNNHSFAFPDVNTAQHQSGQQIPEQQSSHNPLPSTNTVPLTTTSFAYFIQPFVSENEEPRHLTNEQIENAVERIVYDASMSNAYIENTINTDGIIADRCPICLEDFQIGEQVLRINVCGHIFKRPGLLRWFQRNNHCPVCRRNVVENQPSTEEATQTENVQEQTRHTQNNAIHNLLENHIRNPILREFGSFIQNISQNNRRDASQLFFDASLNERL